MKDLIKFWRGNSIKVKLQIIHSFVQLPGFIFHELCHILMALILLVKINKLVLELYKVEGNLLRPFKGEVHTEYNTSTKLGVIKDLLINTAPITGIVILLLWKWWLIIYILVSWDVMKLSQTDKLNMEMNLKLLKK